jgi:hypothetical protein
MTTRARRAAVTATAAFVLAGSAALALPATAGAETIEARCGDTVTAKPGDKIDTPFGLHTVTDGLTSLVDGLLGGLCKVTVKVVDTAVAPVPGVGEPAADALGDAVGGTTRGLGDTAKDLGRALTGGEPAPGNKPAAPGGAPQSPPPEQGPAPAPRSPAAPATGFPAANSPVLAGTGSAPLYTALPSDFATGWAPMRDYGNLPVAAPGLYTPSPGVRYGGQIPGYAPGFGILGANGSDGSNGRPQAPGVQNAGQAQALPVDDGSTGSGAASLPVLLAVLALSGVTAALVRTWVLRKAVPA